MSVYASNNNHPITDAQFSANFYNNQDGNYFVTIDPNTQFWCQAPNYKEIYANTDAYPDIQISLVYTGGWPQTY